MRYNMKLNFYQIKELTVGAVNIEKQDEGIRFYKMQKCQIDAFYALSNILGIRAETTTGIRLDFETDSAFVAFENKGGNRFEYFIDGVYQGNVSDAHVRIELRKPCRVTLAFPSHNIGIIDEFELSDGATATRHKFDRKILFIGDSITQGYDALFPSECYANRLARYYDAEILNQAIGGACFDPAVLQPVGAFDFVVVAYGTNDWSKKNPTDFAADAAAFMARLGLIYGKLPVFVVLPIWRADTHRTDTAGDFMECRATIGRLAATQGFTVLDDYDLLPHDTRLFSDGYLHPNAIGFQFYAENLLPYFEKLLKK